MKLRTRIFSAVAALGMASTALAQQWVNPNYCVGPPSQTTCRVVYLQPAGTQQVVTYAQPVYVQPVYVRPVVMQQPVYYVQPVCYSPPPVYCPPPVYRDCGPRFYGGGYGSWGGGGWSISIGGHWGGHQSGWSGHFRGGGRWGGRR